MSTNMTGGADGGIAIQVRLDTSKASKELNRLEQKILKLQEEVTVGKAKKSALVAQLEQANAELTALQAKTKIDGKSFVISPEDSKRISDLKIQIEQTQTAIEQQNKALSDAQLTLEGVKTRYLLCNAIKPARHLSVKIIVDCRFDCLCCVALRHQGEHQCCFPVGHVPRRFILLFLLHSYK